MSLKCQEPYCKFFSVHSKWNSLLVTVLLLYSNKEYYVWFMIIRSTVGGNKKAINIHMKVPVPDSIDSKP